MIDFNQEALKLKDEMIKDIQTLCKIPSVKDITTSKPGQPFGENCRLALEAMLEIGRRDGYAVKNVDGYAGHIDIGEGEETLGILGHLDVVPVNEEGWNYAPFDITIQEGKMYGRGSADDKGPLIAAYYAAKLIHNLNLPLSKKVRIIFGCDEESGSSCMKYYFTKEPFPTFGFTPDGGFPVVYGEKAGATFQISGSAHKDGLIMLVAGQRANIVPESCEAIVEGNPEKYRESFEHYLSQHHLKGSVEEEGNHTKLTLIGRSAHAASPELGINSACFMCDYLKDKTSNKLVHFIHKYLFDDVHGKKFNVDYIGEMGPLTVNLGIVCYKDEQANITLDLRCPHEINQERLVDHIGEACKEFDFIEEHHIGSYLYIDPNSELIQSLHNAYLEFSDDKDAKPVTMGGGTYAKTMPNCVAFGLGFPGTDNHIHENNEFLSIDDLIKGTAIFAKAIYDLIK